MKNRQIYRRMTAAVLLIVLLVILWHMCAPVPELNLQNGTDAAWLHIVK